jgi:hypothetical protein
MKARTVILRDSGSYASQPWHVNCISKIAPRRTSRGHGLAQCSPVPGRGLSFLLRSNEQAIFLPWMPKDAFTLSDVREPTLTIVCQPCGRRGRYSVERLIAKHGDAKILYLLAEIINCPKARSANIYDRCEARYEGLTTR